MACCEGLFGISGKTSLSGWILVWWLLGAWSKVKGVPGEYSALSRFSGASILWEGWSGFSFGHDWIDCSKVWFPCHSLSEAGRRLSGEHLSNLCACATQTTDELSWLTTRAGPYQRPPSRLFGLPWRLQYMTNWPAWNGPLGGHDLLKRARLIAWSLSVAKKVFRAKDLISSCCRKRSQAKSSPTAMLWAPRDSSAVSEAGTRVALPKTICSGEYPWWRLREFLAWKQALRTVSNSWVDEITFSASYLFNISLIRAPCLSTRPFCHASVESFGTMFRPCKKLNHSSEQNSPAGSE